MSAAKVVRRVGEPVLCNGGYRGTITRVCEWSDALVEVRLERGTVCVDIADCEPVPAKKTFTVHMTFASPAWDEHDGIDFIVTAESKAEAVKRARRQADNAGHMGRRSFRAVEARD